MSRLVGAVAVLAVGVVVACDNPGDSGTTTAAIHTVSESEPPTTGVATAERTPTPTSMPPTMDTPISLVDTGTPSTVSASSGARPIVDVVAGGAFRPYVADPDVCEPVSASESSSLDWAEGRLRPYAISSAGWLGFQVIADPQLEFDGRWAVVGTIPASVSIDVNNWNAAESEHLHRRTINGWPVSITTSPSGFAGAMVDLGGGTDAYVRTYRFDLESIIELINGLSLRGADSLIGFDYEARPDLEGLEVVLDRPDASQPVLAFYSHLECVDDDGGGWRIFAITGDPLAQYVTILDQPYPREIGRIEDAVVSIVGRGTDNGPTLTDITRASPEEWALLPG